MKRLTIVTVALLRAAPLPAWSADALYAAHPFAEPPAESDAAACPSAEGDGLVGYIGDRRVCADATVGNLRMRPDLVDGTVGEVVLLTARPGVSTVYRVPPDRGAILPLANLVRSTGRNLVIRGQKDAAGNHLVWLKGLDLIDTICAPGRVLDVSACREGRVVPTERGDEAPADRRYEMTSLAAVESARIPRALSTEPVGLEAVTNRNARSYCISLSQVRGIDIAELAFEDSLPRIAPYFSSDVRSCTGR